MVDCAGNISSVGSFLLSVGNCLAAPLGRRLMYLYAYNTNFQDLEREVGKLKNKRDELQVEVAAAEIYMEEIRQSVKDWQTKVNNTITEADQLIQANSNDLRCFKGLCPNCIIRYKHSKKAFKLKWDGIDPLLQQGNEFDQVSHRTIQLNYERNFGKLRDDVLKLKNARLKVQRKIEEAKNNVEKIEEDVTKWQKDVDSVIVEAEQLIEKQRSIGTDRKTRHQNSQAASELMVDDIDPLLQQEKAFEKVSYSTVHQEIWLRSTEDYLAFESRTSTEKSVWEALNDKNIYMIGVYGMGGLGKTTLVQEICRKAKKDKLFDEIVFVEVTETLDIKKVQTEIADKLGVKFSNESERASKLYERLTSGEEIMTDKKTTSGKKILLILDNIWEDLNLETIGIPSETDRGECKIMITTRNLDVLQRMDCTSNFGMGILKEEEAWKLFMKMAGNITQACELNSLPKDVCKECGGMPIVICTIAKALRNKSRPSAWKVALQELKAPSPTKFIGLLEKEYVKIALSYKYLRDDELKKTFLIASLMENDTFVSDLFIHVVGLDILEGANMTMEDARDRLDKLVCELKDSCLLLDGFKSGQFAMHDVIRVVAVTIAYTDHHVLTERNDVGKEWKDKDKLKKCTKISLPTSSTIISQLWSKDLDCPNLEYFYITRSRVSSFKIPKDFFTVMSKLKVLSLFEMQQSSMLSSLDLLTNLQTLCLGHSNIEDVAIIGKLKTLKVLSLKNVSIKDLPTEIGHLTQLRILDLSTCWQLKYIAPNVISKLFQLEEMYIERCPIQWKLEIVEEFKHLTQLATLNLDIEDDKGLLKGFFSRELKRYKISKGDWLSYPQEHEFARVFNFKFNSTISLEVLQRIKNVEFLRLAQLSDVEKSLCNSQMRPLFEEQVIFPDIKALALIDINNFQLPTSSFQNLTKLTLERCGTIIYVFPYSIAKSLQQLQQLEITGCQVLEEIVAKEEGENAVANFVFPNLIFLMLTNLPQLTAFYPEIHISKWPMLKELVVINCDKFSSKYLSFLT